MSKHSKHGRGKFRRRMKMQQMQHGAGVIQPTAVNMAASATAPAATAPAIAAPRPMQQAPMQKKQVSSAALPLHYEFIGADLRRIGILTAVVVIVLIVLYIFLK